MSNAEQQQNLARADEKPRAMTSTEVTPSHMLQMAVEQGADLDKLEKLMDLQERWERGEARKAFVASMNRFKENPPKLTKNKTVDYTSSKGRTTYNHASLDHICDTIGKALSDVGISYAWKTNQQENGLVRVTCILTHEAGHSEETALQAAPDTSGGKNSIQAVGSTVTYLQRYTLLAATGMATEDQDDDGTGAGPEPAKTLADDRKKLNEIVDLVNETGADEKKLLRFVFAAKPNPDAEIDDIPLDMYDRVKGMLHKKLKAKGEKQ